MEKIDEYSLFSEVRYDFGRFEAKNSADGKAPNGDFGSDLSRHMPGSY